MATGVVGTKNSNTPAIIAGDGATGVVILAANTARIGFSIQNVGTTVAKIRFGSGATDTVYHRAIKGGTGDGDGLGGSVDFFGPSVYDDVITMYGASTAKVVVTELAP